MAVWVIRAEEDGAKEKFALENNCAVIGYTSGKFPIPDLSNFNSLEELKSKVRDSYGNGHWRKAQQLWHFAKEVQDRDWVVMPMKTPPRKLAFGKVLGDYYHVAECADERARHRRNVCWNPPISRDSVPQCVMDEINRFPRVRGTVYQLGGDAVNEIIRIAESNSAGASSEN